MKEPNIWESLATPVKDSFTEVVHDYENGGVEWKENLSEKIDALSDNLQNIPHLNTPEEQSVSGWFMEIASEEGRKLSQKSAVVDIMEHAEDNGVRLSKKYLGSIEKDIKEQKSTINDVCAIIDRAAMVKNQKGVEWWACSSQNQAQNKPVLRLMQSTGAIQAEIISRKNNTTGDTFYAAYVNEANGKKRQIGTSQNLEGIKSRCSSYCDQIVLHEATVEFQKAPGPISQTKSSNAVTQERPETFQDALDYAKEKKVEIPQKHRETIETAFNENRLNVEAIKSMIDKASERNQELVPQKTVGMEIS